MSAFIAAGTGVALDAVLTALSGAPRSASSCLGTHLSPKLCFARRDLAMAPRFQATRAKQSFEDMGMPKQELGNELRHGSSGINI